MLIELIPIAICFLQYVQSVMCVFVSVSVCTVYSKLNSMIIIIIILWSDFKFHIITSMTMLRTAPHTTKRWYTQQHKIHDARCTRTVEK